MKRPRPLVLAIIAFLTLLIFDLAVTAVVLPRYWRPLPPFGAITNEDQGAWLAEQLAAGNEEPPVGIGCFDQRLGWAYRPHAVSGDGNYHINSRGWRSTHEYEPEPPPEVVRIVACGDSFTFCQEVGDDDAWPTILERTRPATEVINLGVGGFGTDQSLLRFRDEEVGSRLDAVLIGMLLENIGRNVNRYRPRWFTSAARPVAKPRFVIEGNTLRLVEQPFTTRAKMLAAVESGDVLVRLDEHEYWKDPGVPPYLAWSGIARLVGAKRTYARRNLSRLWRDVEGEPFRTTIALLEEFRRHALEDRGARLAPVLIFPTMEDLEGYAERGDHYWSTLTDALDAKGIDYIDLVEPLAVAWHTREEGGGPLFVGTHLNLTGNVLVAGAVRDWLDARLVQ